MDWMNVVASVAHSQSITLALLQMERCGGYFVSHRISHSVNRPPVEALFGSVVFGKNHVEGVIWRRGGCTGFGKHCVVPAIRSWRYPLRFALGARVFDDDSHAVMSIVIG